MSYRSPGANFPNRDLFTPIDVEIYVYDTAAYAYDNNYVAHSIEGFEDWVAREEAKALICVMDVNSRRRNRPGCN